MKENALFKFKFYDRKRKWLMDVVEIDLEQGVLTCVYGTQGWISLIENGELLRSTGRIYGKEEVYEGFLIRHIADGNEPHQALEVYWDTKFAGFYGRSLDDEHLYRIPLPAHDYEVIGNMFEDPELVDAIRELATLAK